MSQETIIVGKLELGDLSLTKLAELTEELRSAPSVVEIPVSHKFTPGMYIREVMVPAGTGVITMVHKTSHPFVVSAGKILVWTKEAGVVFLKAPYTGVTTPGTCRVAIALEDTVWTTFHSNPTDELDIAVLEKMLVWSPREAAELLEKEQKCLS